jgi:hypothetical protein
MADPGIDRQKVPEHAGRDDFLLDETQPSR